MSSDHDAADDRYTVDLGFVLPDLSSLAGDGGRVEVESIDVDSAYFDTEQHDLLRRGVSLRSRGGASGVTWELLDASGATLVELPAGPTGSASSVPDELVALTTGLRRGRPLSRSVLVRSQRVIHRAAGEGGHALATLIDERMHAVQSDGEEAHIAEWREIVVAADDGHATARPRATSLLLRAGAEPATGASGITEALGLASGPSDAKRRPRTAGATIQRFIAEQDEALVAGDLALRRGEDRIHPTRVATRRLRSTLRVFAGYFDPVKAEHLDAELGWLAGLLGAVRDPEVQRARLAKALAELPDDMVIGPVLARIERRLEEERSIRRAALDSAMSGRRYADLLTTTADWAASPPFKGKAFKKPAGTLEAAVAAAAKKVAKRLRTGLRTGDEDELHRARKAGKRARYAAELAHDVLGKKVRRSITRYQRLQDILGEHQDSIVAADLLRTLATSMTSISGENGFTFGLLHAAERSKAERSRAKAQRWSSKL